MPGGRPDRGATPISSASGPTTSRRPPRGCLATTRRAAFSTCISQRGLLDRSPFESLDTPGVGALVEIAAERGRETRADLRLGICGEHGGDPESIAFLRAGGARLRQLLALPGADRPRRRGPGGARDGGRRVSSDDALRERFARLCEIPSPTGFERAVADDVLAELRELGIEAFEDAAAESARAGSGNVIARVPGTGERWVSFFAHLDTVPERRADRGRARRRRVSQPGRDDPGRRQQGRRRRAGRARRRAMPRCRRPRGSSSCSRSPRRRACAGRRSSTSARCGRRSATCSTTRARSAR